MRKPGRDGRRPETSGGPLPIPVERRPPPAARVAAAVGHEIRAPLATTLLYLEIIERGIGAGPSGEASARGAIVVARQQLRRIETLVGRVIEMESHGRARIDAREVDAGRVVSETVRRVVAGDDTAQVSVDIGSPELVDWWDDGALEQIVQNLVSNALKFGKGRPVSVRLERADTALRLSVRDSGVGISLAERERIFLGHSGERPVRSRGLGLGLWLVRELAERHGGTVSVESRPGRGSTFVVTLRPQRPIGPSNQVWPQSPDGNT